MNAHFAHNDRAYLLARVDYGESDRIVTFLCERLGKLSVRARGARKSRKRFGGALEMFALVEISVQKGRAGRLELTEARLLEDHLAIGADLGRFHCACSVLSLTKALAVEEDIATPLFPLLDEALRALCRASGPPCAAVELGFAVSALEALGTGIVADRCAVCARPLPPRRKAFFDPGRGGVVCRTCGGGATLLSAKTLEELRRLGGISLEELASTTIDEDTTAQLENAIRSFVEYHVDCFSRRGAGRPQNRPSAPRKTRDL